MGPIIWIFVKADDYFNRRASNIPLAGQEWLRSPTPVDPDGKTKIDRLASVRLRGINASNNIESPKPPPRKEEKRPILERLKNCIHTISAATQGFRSREELSR